MDTSTASTETIQVCRVCLEEGDIFGPISNNHEALLNLKLIDCGIFENLKYTKNPLICTDCFEHLKKLAKFKEKVIAIESEENEGFQTNKNNDLSKICRLCLTAEQEKNWIDYIQLFVESKIYLDTNITKLLKICTSCFTILKELHLFITTSNEKESIVVSFLSDKKALLNNKDLLEINDKRWKAFLNRLDENILHYKIDNKPCTIPNNNTKNIASNSVMKQIQNDWSCDSDNENETTSTDKRDKIIVKNNVILFPSVTERQYCELQNTNYEKDNISQNIADFNNVQSETLTDKNISFNAENALKNKEIIKYIRSKAEIYNTKYHIKDNSDPSETCAKESIPETSSIKNPKKEQKVCLKINERVPELKSIENQITDNVRDTSKSGVNGNINVEYFDSEKKTAPLINESTKHQFIEISEVTEEIDRIPRNLSFSPIRNTYVDAEIEAGLRNINFVKEIPIVYDWICVEEIQFQEIRSDIKEKHHNLIQTDMLQIQENYVFGNKLVPSVGRIPPQQYEENNEDVIISNSSPVIKKLGLEESQTIISTPSTPVKTVDKNSFDKKVDLSLDIFKKKKNTTIIATENASSKSSTKWLKLGTNKRKQNNDKIWQELTGKKPATSDKLESEKLELETCALKPLQIVHETSEYVPNKKKRGRPLKDEIRETILEQGELNKRKMLKVDGWIFCNVCSFKTKKDLLLKNHKLIHKLLEKLDIPKCSHCIFQTKNERQLQEHMLTHLDLKLEYSCATCGFVSKKTSPNTHHTKKKTPIFYHGLQNHVSKDGLAANFCTVRNLETNEEYLECLWCFFQSTDSSAFDKHIQEHKMKKQ